MTLRIVNELGMHMRAANVFADSAARYDATVVVARGELKVNGKSIMGVMMLAASQGSEIELQADGADDAEETENRHRLPARASERRVELPRADHEHHGGEGDERWPPDE